jgi:hypothetical protein
MAKKKKGREKKKRQKEDDLSKCELFCKLNENNLMLVIIEHNRWTCLEININGKL